MKIFYFPEDKKALPLVKFSSTEDKKAFPMKQFCFPERLFRFHECGLALPEGLFCFPEELFAVPEWLFCFRECLCGIPKINMVAPDYIGSFTATSQTDHSAVSLGDVEVQGLGTAAIAYGH